MFVRINKKTRRVKFNKPSIMPRRH